MADPPPTDPAAHRAERARRNGARSRGPVSERGKARSSRNALRHGLTAKVHLVLERDDEAEFMALAAGLESELAPRGALEGFLVARLTAAMWHTGRAERMEARAFAAATDPDPDRLRLAMRYRGSVQRELFRCLRGLQELRSRPLTSIEGDAGGTGEPEPPETAAGLADPARIAIAAWGGERAGAIPPGFLELRPVPQVWPIAWRFLQDRAFPGDVPLLVYADGTVRSPDGRLLEDVWSPEPLPAQSPAPAAPSSVEGVSAAVAIGTASAANAPGSEHEDACDTDGPLPDLQRRNEPTQAADSAGFLLATNSPDAAASRVGLGRTAPELGGAPVSVGISPAQGASPVSDDDPEPDRAQARPGEPSHTRVPTAWERMWGVPLLETELETIPLPDDTYEPDAAGAHEQAYGNDVPPRTSEPDESDRHQEKYTNELSPCTGEPESEAEAAVRSKADPTSSGARPPPEPTSRPGGRLGRLRRRNSSWRSRGTSSPGASE